MRFTPGGDFAAVNQPLRVLVNIAYQIPLFRVEGMPDWFTSERFDVTAKAPAGPGSCCAACSKIASS
jgi:uncharacterized protein (TIGR03435 family)